MNKRAQISIFELLGEPNVLPESREQIEIEDLIKRVELSKQLKEKGLAYVKEDKKEEWTKEVDESPYNEYDGVDIKCVVSLMESLQKGICPQDVIDISENNYDIPASRSRDLLCEYTEKGEEMYDDILFIQRINFIKKLKKTL